MCLLLNLQICNDLLQLCFLLKDQVLLSFIQDKNPRKSRYMIKLISRIFWKKFPNWKNKRFDQRILSFQIEICSPVIDYQQLKMFITVTRNLNSKFIMCNRLHMDGNRLPAVIEHFDSNFKACNRLRKSCNWLPKENFRK